MKTKICTDIKQSQKLKELEIDVNTADLLWVLKDRTNLLFNFPVPVEEIDKGRYDIPAWSLTALEGLMPFQIVEDNKRYGFKQWKGYNSQGETYRFEYVSNIGTTLYETYYCNNPLDAAFEMVCYLLESHYI